MAAAGDPGDITRRHPERTPGAQERARSHLTLHPVLVQGAGTTRHPDSLTFVYVFL